MEIIIGNYLIKKELDIKSPDGHKLYLAECLTCGALFINTLGYFKNASRHGCTHTYQIGNEIVPRIRWENKRIRRTYYDMLHRCLNPDSKDYKFYGAKGIGVCKEWVENPKSFETWALKNNYADNLTINRKKETRDYSPSNCEWISREENARHKSTTHYFTISLTYTGRQWAKLLGKSINYINKMNKANTWDYTEDFIRESILEILKNSH